MGHSIEGFNFSYIYDIDMTFPSVYICPMPVLCRRRCTCKVFFIFW